jgi:molybdopterin/thiamine biosynthesis adenylyltransferase
VKPAPGLVPTCAEAGVAAPLPGIIGALMAIEAVKWLTGAGEPLQGRLMIHDALYADSRVIAVKRRPECAVCGRAVAGDPSGPSRTGNSMP